MPVTIQLRTHDDLLHLERGFRVFAVRQGESLLLESGVPPGMSASPEVLRDVALTYMCEWLKPRPWLTDAHNAALQAVFVRLTVQYGELEAAALARWIERFFIDQAENAYWIEWNGLFGELALYEFDANQRPLPQLPAPALSRFVSTIREYFNPERDAVDQRRAETARTIPLSPVEIEAVKIEAPDNDGNYPSYADVVTTLQVCVMRVRAYRVWQSLDTWLVPEERAAILVWGRGRSDWLDWHLEMSTHPDTSVDGQNVGSASDGPRNSA
jgi:hypothetical protein